ncbi:MAG: XRE family transcriptional regulator [Calditrichaeota bacterium]|nr:MAG: XRE family transcriptional regulator [Calditrichota bacterium]
MSPTFNVGEKLKQLRKENNLTLQELSSRSGVSTTQISEIERNLTSPTIGTLMKLISALGQETSIFFESDGRKNVSLVRKNERSLIVDQKNQVYIESLTTGIIDSKLKVIITHPRPGHENIPGGYQHPGEELIYVIKGRIQVTLDGRPYTLEAGDAIHFRGELNHKIKNVTEDDVELLAVITPPSY